jgi:hypothetical protein
MANNIFIDESIRKSYLISIVEFSDINVALIRRRIQKLGTELQSKIHMNRANRGLKLRILKEVLSYDLEVVIVEDLNFKLRKSLSRQICLRSAFEYASTRNIDRIVLDKSNSQMKDLTTYQKSSRKFPTLPENLHHIASRQEPLLWLPDISAWSYGAGGIWRELIDEKISFIKRV